MADYQGVDKMSEELLAAGKPFADRDMDDLRELAKASGQTDPVVHWDIAFWAERLREQRDKEVTFLAEVCTCTCVYDKPGVQAPVCCY